MTLINHHLAVCSFLFDNINSSQEHLENHYADLKGKGFFPGLIKYMGSGPVVAMVWQGQGAVKTGRQMLGATNPADSLPGKNILL